MKFERDKRTRILDDIVITEVDPTGSTVELKIGDTWHAAEWLGSPVSASGKWTQTARTIDYFAGPDATPAGATVLSLGRHLTRRRVTKGGDVLTAGATPIDVG